MIYAVKKQDKILVFTIAEGRRATLVNYLLEEAHQRVYNSDTDDYVERLWAAYADGGEIIEVTIKEKPTSFVTLEVIKEAVRGEAD